MLKFNSSLRRSTFSFAFVIATVAMFVDAQSASAQTFKAEDLGGVPIAIIVPSSPRALTEEQKDILGNKLLDAATANGMSGIGGASPFELIPIVTVTREVEVGELQKFKVVTLGITLAIQHRAQNLAFGSTNISVEGNGQTREAAITSALNSIPSNSEKLIAFVDNGKRRIVQYYQQNCTTIRSDARARASTGQAPEAIALLMSVPREAAECQKVAASDAQRLYVVHQDKECASLVRAAHADAANRDFRAAAHKLQQVDPSCACAKDADVVLADIDKKVTQASDREFRLEFDAMKIDRTQVTKSIVNPEKLEQHRKELTRTFAVGVINAKLPLHTHMLKDS